MLPRDDSRDIFVSNPIREVLNQAER